MPAPVKCVQTVVRKTSRGRGGYTAIIEKLWTTKTPHIKYPFCGYFREDVMPYSNNKAAGIWEKWRQDSYHLYVGYRLHIWGKTPEREIKWRLTKTPITNRRQLARNPTGPATVTKTRKNACFFFCIHYLGTSIQQEDKTRKQKIFLFSFSTAYHQVLSVPPNPPSPRPLNQSPLLKCKSLFLLTYTFHYTLLMGSDLTLKYAIVPKTNKKITLLIYSKLSSILLQDPAVRSHRRFWTCTLWAPWDYTLFNLLLTIIATAIELNRISYEQSVPWLKKEVLTMAAFQYADGFSDTQ